MASKQLYFYADYGYGVDGESSGAAAPGITRRMTGGRAQAGAPPRPSEAVALFAKKRKPGRTGKEKDGGCSLPN